MTDKIKELEKKVEAEFDRQIAELEKSAVFKQIVKDQIDRCLEDMSDDDFLCNEISNSAEKIGKKFITENFQISAATGKQMISNYAENLMGWIEDDLCDDDHGELYGTGHQRNVLMAKIKKQLKALYKPKKVSRK